MFEKLIICLLCNLVLRIISKGFQENVVQAPKADENGQATTHFKDKLAARDRYLTRQMKRLIAFRRYKHVHVYTYDTRTDLKRLWELAGTGTGLGITEKNRVASDQLRVRLHCYGIQAKEMPGYSNIAPGIQGAKVFFQTVVEYLKRARHEPMVEKLPLVGSHREARRNIDISGEKVLL